MINIIFLKTKHETYMYEMTRILQHEKCVYS